MSRMDRYYNNSVSGKRTARNQSLYNTIYEDSEYSNIEGIATIDKSNEIDITKIKNMLKNREDFSNNREFKSYTPKREVETYENFETDDDRLYDIRDILNKAKTNKSEEKYHNLDQANIEILKELKNKTKEFRPNDELGNMIDTITNTSKLNKMTDQELGLDMFEDLKSTNNTIIQSKDSIKSILEEVKKQEKLEKQEKTQNMDKSFFTSSMNFTEEDFEQINELKKNVKKNNTLIKILIFIVIITLTLIAVLLVFNFLK